MIQLYIYILLSGLANGLYLPIWILYLSNNQFNLFYIGILGTILEAVRFISEVPLGAFADYYGRKKSLYLGSLFMAISIFIFYITNSFKVIVISMIFMGIGNSFESGAMEAWLSDYLILNDLENELDKRFIQINLLNILGGIIGAVLVMYIYNINDKLSFIFATILFLINFFIALFFIKEVSKKRTKYSVKENLSNMLDKIINSIKYIKKSKMLIYFSISLFFYSWALDGIERFYQTFLKVIGISVENISFIFIISCVVAIILMFLSESLLNKIKGMEINLIIIIRSVMFLLILGSTLINSTGAYISLAIFFSLNYLSNPIIQSFLNKQVTSDIRATFLSVYELVGSCGEIFAGISIGYLAKILGIYKGIRIVACILIPVILFMILCKIYQNKKSISKRGISNDL